MLHVSKGTTAILTASSWLGEVQLLIVLVQIFFDIPMMLMERLRSALLLGFRLWNGGVPGGMMPLGISGDGGPLAKSVWRGPASTSTCQIWVRTLDRVVGWHFERRFVGVGAALLIPLDILLIAVSKLVEGSTIGVCPLLDRRVIGDLDDATGIRRSIVI